MCGQDSLKLLHGKLLVGLKKQSYMNLLYTEPDHWSSVDSDWQQLSGYGCSHRLQPGNL